MVTFGEKYPKYYQLNWHAREVDRRFLVELDRRTWDSVATALQRTLTDSVIQRRREPDAAGNGRGRRRASWHASSEPAGTGW